MMRSDLSLLDRFQFQLNELTKHHEVLWDALGRRDEVLAETKTAEARVAECEAMMAGLKIEMARKNAKLASLEGGAVYDQLQKEGRRYKELIAAYQKMETVCRTRDEEVSDLKHELKLAVAKADGMKQ